MKTYTVSITFKVESDDDLITGTEVRQLLYDAVEMPGYALRGLKVTATGATVTGPKGNV